MHKILLLGAGKIGRMIARMLSSTGEYEVLVADHDASLLERAQQQSGVATRIVDVEDTQQLAAAIAGQQTVISALSYRFNPCVAQAAFDSGASYFDLTEDIETTRRVREIAAQAAPGNCLCRNVDWRRASSRSLRII